MAVGTFLPKLKLTFRLSLPGDAGVAGANLWVIGKRGQRYFFIIFSPPPPPPTFSHSHSLGSLKEVGGRVSERVGEKEVGRDFMVRVILWATGRTFATCHFPRGRAGGKAGMLVGGCGSGLEGGLFSASWCVSFPGRPRAFMLVGILHLGMFTGAMVRLPA